MSDETSADKRRGTSRQDRRRASRWPTGEPGTLTVLLSEKTLEGRLVDMSSSGLRMRVNEPVRPLDHVKVDFRDQSWIGEVRWCRPCGSAHEIGVEITQTVERRSL